MLETFRPLLQAAHGIDVGDPARAEAELRARLAPDSPAARELDAKLIALLEQGAVANKGAPPVKFSRVAKATPDSLDFSIDVVHMSGAGPRHRHPQGEINWCIALDGQPTFEGKPAGWVVMPRDSTHVPTVAGGTMLIVYLLPQGQIEFQA